MKSKYVTMFSLLVALFVATSVLAVQTEKVSAQKSPGEVWFADDNCELKDAKSIIRVPIEYKALAENKETLVGPTLRYDPKALNFVGFEAQKDSKIIIALVVKKTDGIPSGLEQIDIYLNQKDKSAKDDKEHIVPSGRLGDAVFEIKTSAKGEIMLFHASSSHNQNKKTSVLDISKKSKTSVNDKSSKCSLNQPKTEIISFPIIIESAPKITGRSILNWLTGKATVQPVKQIKVKLVYDPKILTFKNLNLSQGVTAKVTEKTKGQLEIEYTSEKDISPGEMARVNFERIKATETNVTLDKAQATDGANKVTIAKKTGVVKQSK